MTAGRDHDGGDRDDVDEPDGDGRRYRLTVDLPRDFALNQPLSTFALAAVELLDAASETYALDVVSVIEATLEDPRQILAAQVNKAKGEAVAQMKAEGIEYEERMELLEEITYPRPLEDLLGHAFDVYIQTNAWAADGNTGSIRILERNGFRPIGRQRMCHVIGGRQVDRLLFDLLTSEWKGTPS